MRFPINTVPSPGRQTGPKGNVAGDRGQWRKRRQR
jgi:hypothetical protein